VTSIEEFAFPKETSSTDLRRNIASSRCQHFRKLRRLYSQLHDIALLVNSTYGFSLLPTILWVFTTIITYENFVLELKGTNLYHFVILSVLWCSFFFSLLTAIALSCSLAVGECNHSPVIVQKIILRDDIDGEIVKELEKMFIQLRAMKIGFTACGLFNLDLPFLCGIIGVTLSYFFVTVQF
jgi:hypothetical protein